MPARVPAGLAASRPPPDRSRPFRQVPALVATPPHGSRDPTQTAARHRRGRPPRGPRPRSSRTMRRAPRARARAGRRRSGQDRRATRSRSARGCSTASRPRPTPSTSRRSSRAPRGSWRRQFTDQARTVAEHFGKKVDEVFGAGERPAGQGAREALRATAAPPSVQNRVRELVAETLAQVARGPGAPVLRRGRQEPAGRLQGRARPIKQAASARTRRSARCCQQLGELSKELQALRDEKEKLEEVDAERERGTAKGRTFEEAVAEAVDAHRAAPRATWPRRWGTQPGATGKTGDVVVDIDACDGPARGRIVFEAKDRRLSKPAALEELDRALRRPRRRLRGAGRAHRRGAAGQARAPARVQRGQAAGGTRSGRSRGLALEVAYRLARARVLMARGGRRAWTAQPYTTWWSGRSTPWTTFARSRASSPARRPESTGPTRWSKRWPHACAGGSPRWTRSCSPARRGMSRTARRQRTTTELEL